MAIGNEAGSAVLIKEGYSTGFVIDVMLEDP